VTARDKDRGRERTCYRPVIASTAGTVFKIIHTNNSLFQLLSIMLLIKASSNYNNYQSYTIAIHNNLEIKQFLGYTLTIFKDKKYT
jgi:uncharacterized membrane protein